MKKIAIIGASYLQLPLIEKAKKLGYETHVFAWKTGDIGEKSADYFYPISITEKDNILKECRRIGISGVCTIASDLAYVTVNYIANNLNLVCNSEESALKSTNKYYMRKAFEYGGDPSPKCLKVNSSSDLSEINLKYPLIVKPVDRSGSRGVTKINKYEEIKTAIDRAINEGFEKQAILEEFVDGKEYSVECISQSGIHHFLAITEKITTGEPHFIEIGHIEPASIKKEMILKIERVIEKALNTLDIKEGASHSELKIDKNGDIKIIEIGSRMGGDFIGSHLVELSTGIDFVENVIRVAMGDNISLEKKHDEQCAAIRFIFDNEDINVLNSIKKNNPEMLIQSEVFSYRNENIMDSSMRNGYFIFASKNRDLLNMYLPLNR